MHSYEQRRPRIVFSIAALVLLSLACILTRVQRQEEIDVSSLSEEELIEEYLDQALEQVAFGEGCNRFAIRRELEQAVDRCDRLYVSTYGGDFGACMDAQMKEYREEFKSACTTPTISPLDNGEASETGGSLDLISYQAVMDVCTQEQQGHAFRIECDVTIQVDVEYTAASLPASVFCEARRTFILAQAEADLNDPEGELTLSIPVTGIEAVYPDEDSDGAADGPFFGHGSLPGEDTGDGQVFSLVCGIGPTTHDSTSAWDSFTCSPTEETGSGCDPVFIDLSGAHP